MRALLIPLYGVLAAAGASAQLPQYSSFQLQARSNLLVNDNGFNLPPGSSFNSISAHIDEQARVSFPVQVVPSAGGGSHPGVWFGADGTGTLYAALFIALSMGFAWWILRRIGIL